MDPRYATELAQDNIAVTQRPLTTALSLADLKAYHLVVVADAVTPDEAFTVGAVDVPNWWDITLPNLRRYVEQGGGVLVGSHFREGGEGLATAVNRMLAPWGARVQAQQIIDPGHIADFSDATLAGPETPGRTVADGSFYCWTERIAAHPATLGVHRLYYPVVNMRWDDCYTTPPWVLLDSAWTPLVRAMAGSGAYTTKTDKQYAWLEPLGHQDVIAAVRPAGAGRVGVISVNSYFTFFRPYTTEPNLGENHHGAIEGIFLHNGDGRTPSDGQRLLLGLFRWLAAAAVDTTPTPARTTPVAATRPEPAVATPPARSGEVPAPTVAAPTADTAPPTRIIDWDRATVPPTWRHRPMPADFDGMRYYDEQPDITIKGPLRYFRALIGVHSASSDGQGTVAEYAAAGRRAGYALIAFTERFEDLGGPEKWEALVQDCLAQSDDQLVCLPGIDIADPEGGRYLVFGQPNYPARSWLSADGRYLVANNALSLGFTTHMALVARPQHSPHVFRLFKHFQGVAVATYRNGALVDDGLEAYSWQVASGSNPIPVAVHEVYSPADVPAAAGVGFQQIMPADTVPHAADYFRCALSHFFDCPVRYFISEGPIIDTLAIRNKDEGQAAEGRHLWRLALGARDSLRLTDVQLYQDGRPWRHWRPQAISFRQTIDGYHGWQHHWFAVFRDEQGRRAVGPALRTVTDRWVCRCGDRQNWLGEVAAQYTGMGLRELDLHLPVEGLEEGAATWRYQAPRGAFLAPMLEFPFTSDRVCNTDFLLGQRYAGVTSFNEFAFDAAPMRVTVPARLYDGRVRAIHFTPRGLARSHLNGILYDIDLRLRQTAERRGTDPVWPWFATVKGAYRHRSSAGWQTGDAAAAGCVDLVPGDLVGDWVVLSPGLRLAGGQLGLVPPQTHPVPAGARFTARLLQLNRAFGETASRRPEPFDVAGRMAELSRDMGFDGPTPYRLSLDRGRLAEVAWAAHMIATDGGVAGAVDSAAIPYDLPLIIEGLNPRWSAGVWRSDVPDRVSDPVVVEGTTGYTTLDVNRGSGFYVGHWVTADQPEVCLQVEEWTAQRLRVEVHNPTEQPLTTTLRTPAEVPLMSLHTQLTVAPGVSVHLTVDRQGPHAAP